MNNQYRPAAVRWTKKLSGQNFLMNLVKRIKFQTNIKKEFEKFHKMARNILNSSELCIVRNRLLNL